MFVTIGKNINSKILVLNNNPLQKSTQLLLEGYISGISHRSTFSHSIILAPHRRDFTSLNIFAFTNSIIFTHNKTIS